MKKLKNVIISTMVISMLFGLANFPVTVGAAEITEGDIFVPIDMSAMYNVGNIYSSIKNEMGSAGYAGAFNYDDFKSTQKHQWKNEWTSGMIDNVLIHNDVEFNMRVIDHKGYSNQRACVFWNNGSSAWVNVDIEDGYYKSLELLANSDRPTTINKSLAVKLNYSDGSQEVKEFILNYFCNDGTRVFESTSNDVNWTAGKELTNTGKISHFSFDVNIYKELESFDILNDKFDFVMEDTDVYAKDENGNYLTTNSTGKNRGNYTHTAAIYAMTLVQNDEMIEEAIKEQVKKLYTNIKNAITALGNIDALKYSQKEDLDNISDMIAEIIGMGYPATADEIPNYADYEKALLKMEEIKVKEAQDSIKNQIATLGDVESLTFDRIGEVESITENIEKAKNDGIEINALTVENYDIYLKALAKAEELKVEKKLKDIDDAIAALEPIEELTKADSTKIDAIQSMIDDAQAEGIEISKKTLENYNLFKMAQQQIKSLTPVSFPVDISDYYNTGFIYSSNDNDRGSAGFAGTFYYPSVIEDLDWENEWDESVTDNYITINDVRFRLRVLDNTKNTASCVWKNSDKDNAFSRIDLEDDNYTVVHLLANSDVQVTPEFKRLGVKINYSDGTYDLNDFLETYLSNGYSPAGKEGFTAVACGGGKGSVTHYEIDVDYNKVLTDIEILNYDYDFVLNEESGVSYKDNVITGKDSFKYDEDGSPLVTANGEIRYSSHHATTIYALSMEMPYDDYMEVVKARIEANEAELATNIEYSNGSISKLYSSGKEIYNQMAEDFKYVDDEEYEESFANYNAVKKAIPVLKNGKFTVKDDVITAELIFDKDMSDLEGLISVNCDGEDIPEFTLFQSGNTASISFINRFDDSIKYKIVVNREAASSYGSDFTMGRTVSYSFNTDDSLNVVNAMFTGNDGVEIADMESFTGNTVIFKARLDNYTGKSRNYFVIICAYDTDGVLISAEKETGTLQNERTKSISKTVYAQNAKALKAIFIDGTKGMKTIGTTISK